MGIATPNPIQFITNQNPSISMSQDYHQNIFNFSNNGFERSSQQQQQQHIAQQIRRDKLRIQGFDPPPPLVGIGDVDEEESAAGVNYETAGMLSEMFNFPSAGPATATELLENQILQSYRNPRPPTADWFPHRHDPGVSKIPTVINDNPTPHHHHHHHIPSINAAAADSAAAMQLFLMNPQQQQQQQQQRSPSPSPSNPPPSQSTSSTLHMLLPNPANGGAFSQFTWVNPHTTSENNPSDQIPGIVEGQGLSLSLSSSLQHSLDAAKAEELRIGESNMLFFGQGSNPTPYNNNNRLGHNHNQPVHVGLGSSSYGAMNMLRNSKYAKAAQELLEEFCSVGRNQFKKNKFRRQNNNNNNGNPSSGGGAAAGNSSSSSKDVNPPPLSAADRLEHQRRKVKLLAMLDEVDRRYNHYCEQMQMVVNSFDMVMGFGSAVPYTSLAQKAMSRHFRCLKDAIAAQLKHSCEMLGEKDAGSSGVTKGETPRLRMLEQSLRQQRAFHQMGMMEQEAWRPQRGLPERSVNILRAWLFEHFLHPYPSDADKHLLARQTGLSRNQVSNWFINARVRLWKPMVEEMYQQEAKDDDDDDVSSDQRDQSNTATAAQTPMPPPTTATTTAITTMPAGRRPEINALENDTSFVAINNQCLVSDHNQANVSLSGAAAADAIHDAANNADIEAALIRFGTSAGDVSLTLGLRHAGNVPEKGSFSVRDFGGC